MESNLASGTHASYIEVKVTAFAHVTKAKYWVDVNGARDLDYNCPEAGNAHVRQKHSKQTENPIRLVRAAFRRTATDFFPRAQTAKKRNR
ncbi:hypothetical protein T265_07730 [Opisthorchis viverrini]|uniref:Uncharacterized protein n=1 Tax=Opisthorchis viverrini TaxID=6198 RepID=A0A074ZMY9_OPIVI|nr:hypothetical protein T265_07730 [Opisthorchis viverrini]KER24685.1 hypothetical protein T265_07730 [Opisthorchis viverrini]